MNTPASVREPSKCRSLQTLQADYSAFEAAGGDIRRAKFYNNVIAPYFFEVPLEQVCTHVTFMPSIHIHLTKQVTPPGLHISLGIFYRLFKLLESECHRLDLKLALTPGASNLAAGWSFENHVALQREKEQLDEKVESADSEIESTEAQAMWYTPHLPDAETNPNLAILFQELEKMKKEKETMVSAH